MNRAVPTKSNQKNSRNLNFISSLTSEKLNKFFSEEPVNVVEQTYGSTDYSVLSPVVKSNNSYNIPKIDELNCIKIINNFPLKKVEAVMA